MRIRMGGVPRTIPTEALYVASGEMSFDFRREQLTSLLKRATLVGLNDNLDRVPLRYLHTIMTYGIS